MRKLNAVIGPAMIILLLIHGITGAMQLWGIIPGGSSVRKILSIVLAVLVGIHACAGIKLTADTIIACKKAGRSCFKNNERFWLSRISGLSMLLFLIYHIMVFSGSAGDAFRLQSFQGLQLTAHLLLVLVLIIHLITNITPLFIALGIEDRRFVKDIMIILALVLLACAAAFVFYYLRWNVLWRLDH